jgi:glucose/mannose-6-phosphate isomerase
VRCLVEEEMPVPMAVIRGYSLPAYVGINTLMIAVSYSGNTEETFSAFRQGLDAGAMGYVITGGGQLDDLAESLNIPRVRVPKGLPPRCSLGYLFIPVLLALDETGLISLPGRDLQEAIQLTDKLRKSYAPDCPREENPAKQLALELQGSVPVIYGSLGTTETAALRWKTQFNENSKAYATYNILPEMNHNEIVGWDALPELSTKTAAIFLRDSNEHPSVNARMEISSSILQEKGLTVYQFWSQGESPLARLLSLIYLGDYTSYYLALLNEIDPTPVDMIDELKRKLTHK